jgi:hypothetical protein
MVNLKQARKYTRDQLAELVDDESFKSWKEATTCSPGRIFEMADDIHNVIIGLTPRGNHYIKITLGTDSHLFQNVLGQDEVYQKVL